MDNLEKMRHTLSHVLAAAVLSLYKDAKFGIGPAIETGFYYDIDFGDKKLTDDDLKKIEKKMREIIGRKPKMEKRVVSREEALKWAKSHNQSYKAELIEELPEKSEISFYDLGDLFTDLCKGPHVSDLSKIGAFKLDRIAGAYWRGDEKREMLTRIYGLAFETQEELDDYIKRQEEAKARDHRKLGKELDLFCFSDLVGSGLPLFTPRGTVLRETLGNYSLSLRAKKGFEKVWTPHITKIDLYKTSGHYAKFGEGFAVEGQISHDHFMMKPMNCPHHTQIFASRPRTYKEMPVRYMECTTDYRDEKTGELGGLNRVRSLTQDDSHVFCRNSQIKEEVASLVKIIKELYSTVGMEKLRVRLSYRDDSDSYLGDKKLWESAQKQIKELAIENELDCFEAEGEAAFYGPKLDFMAEDAIGREHQVATVQLDFVLPERFNLEFTNENGEKERPVMIHHATLGSIERFMSVFIEHTGGWFPFWCAPEQVRIITVNNTVSEYVDKITNVLKDIVLETPLKHNELRFTIDAQDDSLGKKIKRAAAMKIPVVLVIGPKDMEAKTISIRLRDEEKTIKFEELEDFLRNM